MTFKLSRILVVLTLVVVLAVGCGGGDGSENGEPTGSGGSSPSEATASTPEGPSVTDAGNGAAVDTDSLRAAIDEVHGALGSGGAPRLPVGFMTSQVVDSIPVDVVDSFNVGVEQVFAWIVYDGLDSGEMEAELRIPRSLSEDQLIANLRVEVSGGHGWTAFEFTGPEGSWAAGNYEAVISADGVEYVIEFIMNFHPTHGSALADADGRVQLPGAASMPGAVSGNWQVADVAVPDDGFSGLLVDSGRCLAFNYRGALAVSDDGASWEAVSHPFEVAPTRFGVANGRFFGFTASRPNQYVSGDGTAWTRFEMGSHDPLVNIFYTHDGYLGSSERSIMMHSEDGIDWQRYGYEEESYTSLRNVYLKEVNRYFYHDGRHWFVKEDGIESGTVLHDPDNWIPFGEDETRIASSRLIINGDTVIFWRHGTKNLWEFTGNGFVPIDTDLGGDVLSTIVPRDGGYVGVRGDGAVLQSADAVDWHVVTEAPETGESPGASAVVGDRLVVIFGGALYSTPLN